MSWAPRCWRFGMGAAAAARDPRGNRALLWVEIVFTGLSAAELVRKVVVDEGGQARTWLLLAALLAGLGLLIWVYPAASPQGHERPTQSR